MYSVGKYYSGAGVKGYMNGICFGLYKVAENMPLTKSYDLFLQQDVVMRCKSDRNTWANSFLFQKREVKTQQSQQVPSTWKQFHMESKLGRQ